MKLSRFTFVVCVSLFTISPEHGFGSCGSLWSNPKEHFDGVDRFGYPIYRDSLGEVDFGGGMRLPLNIEFSSRHEVPSPYLGYGWAIPLLESRCVHKDENTFVLNDIIGRERIFTRDRETLTVFHGTGKWKALVKGSSISAWAPCGWRLDFRNGAIASITSPENRQIGFDRSRGALVAVREGGAVFLSVDCGGAPAGYGCAITLNGVVLSVTLRDVPWHPGRISVAPPLKIRSLSSVTGNDTTPNSFTYSLDQDGFASFSAVVGKDEKVLRWDLRTGGIAGDKEWEYHVDRSATNSGNAAITRWNKLGQREYWYRDEPKGEEIYESKGGTKTVKSWHTTGILRGRPRETVEYSVAGKRTISSAEYDTAGNPTRVLRSDGAVVRYRPVQSQVK